MDTILRTLVDPATYRRLVYLLLGLPLGVIWFVALITTWSLSVGLVVTPLVIPLLFVLAYMTRGFAAVEADIARSLLGVDAQGPALPAPAAGFWARLRSLFGEDFWRAQAFLWLRWFAGFPLAVVLISLLGAAGSLIFAPFWVPFVPDGVQLGFWHPHTFLASLVLIPVGLVMLPLVLLLVEPLAAAYGSVASGLLTGSGDQSRRLSSSRGAATAVAGRASAGMPDGRDGPPRRPGPSAFMPPSTPSWS